MSKKENPWSKRFQDILDIDEIKRRAGRPARQLLSLEKDTVEHACSRIDDELQEIFVATSRAVEILHKFIEHAHSHSLSRYLDMPMFLRQCYDGENDTEPYLPYILTGPAGTGKTQLAHALMRILPQSSTIQPDPYHPAIPLIAARYVAIKTIKKLSGVLQTLAGPTSGLGTLGSRAATSIDACARWQYICGTSLLIADELQFISQSSQASTRIAQVLLGLSYLLMPTVFIGNYSLIHRLRKRPQEERQRLLGRPLILLLPDLPSSADWAAVLTEYQRAVPGVYQFDFVEKRNELWSLCAGLKRELIKLLIVGYRQCRRRGKTTVSWEDIEFAYRSPDFFDQRTDIEELIVQSIDGTKGRDDLRCPIPTDLSLENEYLQALKDVRAKKVAEVVIWDAMTKDERMAAKQEQAAAPMHRSKHQATSQRRREKLSASDLQENAARYRNQSPK
ncbi:hypothetical protein ACXZ1M_13480 [Duganella sp. PWIR1]